MAKKRRIKTETPDQQAGDPKPDATSSSGLSSINPMAFASASLAGAIVYATYYPSDSVAVERGDALWFGVIALLIWTATTASALWMSKRQWTLGLPLDRIDVLCLAMSAWVMIGAFCTCPPGNLRFATNEAWLWVSGAAIFTSARWLCREASTRKAVLALLLGCGVLLAVHGLHQQWITLPRTQAEYRSNPEDVLRKVGIVAPEGSAERMIFENRLFDGGPTGTFALANSLAGVLVVACVLSFGLIRVRWGTAQNWLRVSLVVAFMICALCLWAARSRSAMAACALSCVALAVFASGNGLRRGSISALRRRLLIAAGSLLAVAVGLVCLIASVGRKEWFEQAPASIAFRFQYWRSTFRMVLDQPLFGSGPGNFQSIYERYREPSASEQIADPHNWLFETLASSGFVGLAILGMLLVCSFILMLKRWRGNESQDDLAEPTTRSADASDSVDSKWIALGAGVATVMIWLLGAASGMLPDIEAHLFAVPIAVVASLVAWCALDGLDSHGTESLTIAALIGLMIHLLAAGGWTIPGVAILVWVMSGMLTRRCSLSTKSAESGKSRSKTGGPNGLRMPLAATFVLGIGTLLTLWQMSLVPVQNTAEAMRQMKFHEALRQLGPMRESLREAVAADTWSADEALYESDILKWELVVSRDDSPSKRQDWSDAMTEVLDRAGENPTVYRSIAMQRLHMFQRWNDPNDLSRAQQILEQAAQWSPANEWMAAQLAAIYELDSPEKSLEWTRKADHLSRLGGNIQRSLKLQLVCEPRYLGVSVRSGAKLRPASEVLANQLDKIRVSDQN